MSKYNIETLQNLEKDKLIKLLDKEGIEASIHQPKAELIRLLMLAQRANAPTAAANFVERLPSLKKKYYGLAGVVVVLLSVLLLYFLNNTFRGNINFIVNRVFNGNVVESQDFGPTIFERGGKTYVVYDYPLINVKAIHDPNCKRPECSLDNFYNQIRSFISPLVKFNPIDYNSRQGQSLINEYNLNLLPVFIFDTNIEKTENFENSRRNLEKVKDRYVLQVPPYKVLSGPRVNDARTYLKPEENVSGAFSVVQYIGFSCRICRDYVETIKRLNEILENRINLVVKYFNTSEKDLPASIAAECAAQQDKFREYYDILFERQDDWLNKFENELTQSFIGYAVELGLSRNIFSSCLEDDAVRQIVLNHFVEAGSLGVSAAPTLFVRNNVLVGAYPLESLQMTILEILRN
jgi:protein-disulfide isomerase